MQYVLATPLLTQKLDSARRAGGTALVDRILIAVEDACGEWVTTAHLDQPARLEDGHLLAARLREGVVDAQFALPNAHIISDGDRLALTFRDMVPEIVITAARGRRLGDVVQGVPSRMHAFPIRDVKALASGRTIVVVHAPCEELRA